MIISCVKRDEKQIFIAVGMWLKLFTDFNFNCVNLRLNAEKFSNATSF